MKKEVLWQSDQEWLATGKFKQSEFTYGDNSIHIATTEVTQPKQLVVMLGGVPRGIERQKKLPLINKLYGSLALKLMHRDCASLLMHHPGTGKSTGDITDLTMLQRIELIKNISVANADLANVDTIAFVGMSAGSYMAARANTDAVKAGLKSNNLILQSPAAYPRSIHNITYGRRFAENLKKPWDPEFSPVFTDITSYVDQGGKVYLSYFEKDNPPIPNFIQQAYGEWVTKMDKSKDTVELNIIDG